MNHSNQPFTHMLPRHHAYVLIGRKEGTAPLVEDIFLAYGIARTQNPNVLVKDTEVFTIDEARALKHWAFETPLGAPYKIALIYADTLAVDAQHALLKLLEEPPSSTVFVFILPRAHTLLPTVRSRVSLHHAHEEKRDVFSKEAQTFLEAPLKERLLFAAKVSEKVPELFSFLDALEKACATRMHGNKTPSKIIETLYLVRQYAADKGASRKMLVELLAMSF